MTFPAQKGEKRLIFAICLATGAYEWSVFVTTFFHPGLIGLNFIGPGTDWMVFHAAAQAAIHGHFTDVFDGFRFTNRLNEEFGGYLSQRLVFRPFVSPPSFLVLVIPFSQLTFWVSYSSFQILTGTAMLGALSLWRYRGNSSPRLSWRLAVLCLVCPAAAINCVSGQVAFLIVALLLTGFSILEKRPMLAGLLLGLLTFKPQFFPLIPIVMVAAGHWRGLAGAFLGAAALAVSGLAVVGWGPWVTWLDGLWGAQGRLMARTLFEVSHWGDSLYTIAGAAGLPAAGAVVLQGAGGLFAAWACVATIRHGYPAQLRVAILLASSLLAAPHFGDYDYVCLVAAGVLWLGFGGDVAPFWKWILFMTLWIVPLLGPPQVSLIARLTPLLIVGFVLVLVREGRLNGGAYAAPSIPT